MIVDSNTRLLIIDEEALTRIIHDEVVNALNQSTKEVREVANGTLTRKQASEYLKICLPTIDKLCKEGRLHPTRMGRKLIFRKLEVENLMNESYD